jgi:hypothetical protein
MTIDEAIQTVIIDKLKKSIVANDMIASKALLNSVHFEKKELLEMIEVDIIALDYIVGLDQGIGPTASEGWTKDFTRVPKVQEIQKWIDAKGLDLNAFAVRANIIKFGTSWYKKGGSHIVTDSINDEAFKQVVELASSELKIKIKDQWQLLFKNNR